MLDIRDDVAPGQHGERSLRDLGVDGLSVLDVPDDEGVVLTDAGEEFVIWREH